MAESTHVFCNKCGYSGDAYAPDYLHDRPKTGERCHYSGAPMSANNPKQPEVMDEEREADKDREAAAAIWRAMGNSDEARTS